MVNVFVALHALGVFPTLDLSSEEVQALTAEDTALLRDELGARAPMLAALCEVARVPGRHLRLDFEAQAITVCADVPCAHVPSGSGPAR